MDVSNNFINKININNLDQLIYLNLSNNLIDESDINKILNLLLNSNNEQDKNFVCKNKPIPPFYNISTDLINKLLNVGWNIFIN